MGKLELAAKQTNEKVDRKNYQNRQESSPKKEGLNSEDQHSLSISEATFQPQRDRHAMLLSGPLSGDQQVNMVLRLQRTYGNAYVQRLLSSMPVQAKLTVSSPGDVYEQEADRVADSVSGILKTQAQKQSGPEKAQTKTEYQLQLQSPDEEESDIQAKPLAESINTMGLQQGDQAMLQRGILDKIKNWFSGLAGPKKQPEAKLTDEEATRLLAELEQEIDKESGEAKPPEAELTEEEERMLAEFEQGGEKKPEKELSDEESEKQLAELNAHLEEEPEEEMSAQELDGEIDRLIELTDVLSDKFNILLHRQAVLAQKYGQLVVKDKDAEAEKVLKESQRVIEQREQIEEKLQEAFNRLTELQGKKQEKISEILAKPLEGLSAGEDQVTERELEELEDHSPEQEKRQSEIEERLKPETSKAVVPGVQEVVPGVQEVAPGTNLKPDSIKEDPLDWLTKRELSPEEEAEMDEELAELERQFAEEDRVKELVRLLGSIAIPGTKPGEAEEEAEEEEQPERRAVLAKSTEQSPLEVPSDLEKQIDMKAGSGQPLSNTVRLPMEQAFGTDFSAVTVHTDSEAHSLNESLQARAFTTGRDIFFRNGEYSPGSESGQKLIAHELTHVVQQTGNNKK
jgi:hypothetical protein